MHQSEAKLREILHRVHHLDRAVDSSDGYNNSILQTLPKTQSCFTKKITRARSQIKQRNCSKYFSNLRRLEKITNICKSIVNFQKVTIATVNVSYVLLWNSDDSKTLL